MNIRLTPRGQFLRVLHCLCRFRSPSQARRIPTSGVRNSDTQARINKRSLAALSKDYFTVALSGEIYLAISIPAPTAASSQTEVITTKATRAGVDFISSFLRISAASASSRHSVSTSGGIIL